MMYALWYARSTVVKSRIDRIAVNPWVGIFHVSQGLLAIERNAVLLCLGTYIDVSIRKKREVAKSYY